ncbi:MAG: helix-turn-helix domain-containing protein [Bacteroidaceae bacterium]|nr:helix-turn-helix domain-containing protein [Bacteroidaceae bacterium]
MPKTKKCAYCGKVFTTNSGMQKYCSEECAEQAKETKKKRQRDFLQAIEPVMEIHQQEYLTFSKAAILLGCTRQYVYKLVEQGKLPASRLSSRMALVRRSDIERMFEANPYNRVIPCSKPKKPVSKKLKSLVKEKAKEERATDEVLEYYSGEEVKQIYKVKQSWLYASAKRHQIPMCRIAGRNYYSKKHIDAVFGTSIDLDSIVDWLTSQEVADRYGINLTAVRSYAHRHKIPSKREYGHTYYSQSHFDELRRTDLLEDENYYTVEQVQQLYGLTKANICHIVKVKHIDKTKVGRLNLLLRSDVERAMEERKAIGRPVTSKVIGTGNSGYTF